MRDVGACTLLVTTTTAVLLYVAIYIYIYYNIYKYICLRVYIILCYAVVVAVHDLNVYVECNYNIINLT